jgi:hypothetical protein
MHLFTNQSLSFIFGREKIYGRLVTKFKLDNGADPTEDEIVTLREQAAEISDQIIGASAPYRGYITVAGGVVYSMLHSN